MSFSALVTISTYNILNEVWYIQPYTARNEKWAAHKEPVLQYQQLLRLKQDLISKNKIFLLTALDLNTAVKNSSYTSLRIQTELCVVNYQRVCRPWELPEKITVPQDQPHFTVTALKETDFSLQHTASERRKKTALLKGWEASTMMDVYNSTTSKEVHSAVAEAHWNHMYVMNIKAEPKMESRTTAEHIQHWGKLLKTKQQQQKHQDLLCYILKKKESSFPTLQRWQLYRRRESNNRTTWISGKGAECYNLRNGHQKEHLKILEIVTRTH